MYRHVFVLLPLLLLSAAPTSAAEAQGGSLIVFGAASLTDVLQKISAQYTQQTGVQVKLSFAASSALAKQIESGAQADVFFSADQEWMNYLNGKGLIATDSRTDLLGNRLVLIAPEDSKATSKLERNAPILAVLGPKGRLSTGDPDSVPAGKYAKAALTSLNVWGALEPRLARAENVRVALAYVARGEAPLGIVYATDAAVEPRVRIVDTFPENSHSPITYPVARTKNAKPSATSYLMFLRSASARAVFEQAGFDVLVTNP